MIDKTMRWVFLVALTGAVVLGACSSGHLSNAQVTRDLPTPTLNPFFHPATMSAVDTRPSATPGNQPLIPITLSTDSSPEPSATPAEATATTIPDTPTLTATLAFTDTPSPTFTDTPMPTEAYQRVMLFDEGMSDNWALKYSTQMKFNEKDSAVNHNSATSLSFTPLADYGTLLFALRQTSKEAYLRSDAVGVSFWLYSDEEIAPSDLTVSILGSNRFAFWFQDDHSVTSDQQPVFPETRLYYLDINRPIPPQTWVQIEVWLDDLIYEPEYKNVVGIQIKNDAGFLDKVYLDQVELLMNLTQP